MTKIGSEDAARLKEAIDALDEPIYDEWALKQAEAALEVVGSTVAACMPGLADFEDDVVALFERLEQQHLMTSGTAVAAKALIDVSGSIDYTTETPDEVFEEADEYRSEVYENLSAFAKAVSP